MNNLIGLSRPLNINVTFTNEFCKMYQDEIHDITTINGDVYCLWCIEDELNPMVFENAINAGFAKFRIDDSTLNWIVPSLFKYEDYISELIFYWSKESTKYQTDIIKCDWMDATGYNLLNEFRMSKEKFTKVDVWRWVNNTWRVYEELDNFYIHKFTERQGFGDYYLADNIKLIKERIGYYE